MRKLRDAFLDNNTQNTLEKLSTYSYSDSESFSKSNHLNNSY